MLPPKRHEYSTISMIDSMKSLLQSIIPRNDSTLGLKVRFQCFKKYHYSFTLDRTGRILNAIDELYNLLLDSDDRHDLHADVMNELRGLRKRLQPIQSANGKLN